MSVVETLEKLKAAGDVALAGENPFDTFSGYDLTVEGAARWCAAWVEEISEKAEDLGEDPNARDFVVRLCLGALAVGVEHGRRTAR